MSQQLFISHQLGETLFLLLSSDHEILDLEVRRAKRGAWAGDRYLGPILSLDRGLQAAFVALGEARDGFLPLAKSQRLHEGQLVEVEVQRASSQTKGARLRLIDPEAQGEAGRIGECPDLLERLCRSENPAQKLEIFCNSADYLSQRLSSLPEGLGGQAKLMKGSDFPVDIDELFLSLIAPRVSLAGGGDILIEPIETLTAIDVNSGRHLGRHAGQMALEVNLLAVPEVARQIRLRGLCGLIVVDFLEMETKAARAQLQEALSKTLKEDPLQPQLLRIGAGGLAEITRQRVRPPLHELLCRRVGYGGSGWGISLETQARFLLRALAGRAPSSRVEIQVGPALYKELCQGASAQAFEAAQTRWGGALDLTQEPGREEDNWEIR